MTRPPRVGRLVSALVLLSIQSGSRPGEGEKKKEIELKGREILCGLAPTKPTRFSFLMPNYCLFNLYLPFL